MSQATWDEECAEIAYRSESLRRWSMREQATANDCKCVGQFVCRRCKGGSMDDPVRQHRELLAKVTGCQSLGLWVHCYQTFTTWTAMIGDEVFESETFAGLEQRLKNRFQKPE